MSCIILMINVSTWLITGYIIIMQQVIQLSNASVINLEDDDLVEPNETYIACARYHRVFFKNVGNLFF